MQNYDNLFARRAASTSRTSKYDSQLDAQTRADLDAFVEFAKRDHTDGTSRSYRSLVAKALACPELELSRDQRSAVKLFEEFMKS